MEAARRFVPAAALDSQSPRYWSERIFLATLAGFLFLSPLAFVPNLPLIISQGYWVLLATDIGAFLSFISILCLPGLGFKLRAAWASITVYAVGAALVWSAGPLSGVLVWLFTFPVVAGTFLGLRVALAALGLNALTLLGAALLFDQGWWARPVPIDTFLGMLTGVWTSFMLLNAFAAISVSILVRRLDLSHQGIKEAAISLEEDRARLFASTKKLEAEINERREAEAALKRSERRYREFYESLRDGTATADLEGRIIEANPALLTMLGYDSQEIGRLTIQDITPPRWHRAEARTIKNQVLTRGYSEVYEKEFLKKDGTALPIETRAHLRRDEQGGAAGIWFFVRDITSRKKAEEERLKLASLVENSSDLIGLADLEGRVFYLNTAGCRLVGLAGQEEAATTSIFDYVAPEDLEIITAQAMPAVMARGLWRGEGPVRNFRTGQKIQVEVNFYMITDPLTREPMCLATVMRDITDRKRAEQVLRESKDTLVAVLEGIEAEVHVADLETHALLYLNRQMKERCGPNLEGTKCYRSLGGSDRPCAPCAGQRLLDAEGRPGPAVVWEDKNPLTGRWYINSGRAIRWVDGRLARLRVASDITALKEAEENKLKLEAQLRQAQKMEALGTLAGGIAHDFNNILYAMIGYTELAMNDLPEEQPARKHLDQVHQAGLRARDLVRQILSFSRQAEQEFKPLVLGPIIREVLKLLRSSLPATIEIRSELAAESETVLADPTRIHQMLMNLCTNAAQSMGRKGGLLEVALERVEVSRDQATEETELVPGGWCRLTVRDTGRGMDEATLARIFEPFFTTKDIGQGTGLGLAVVHGIVKSHGGVIKAESRPGRGSRFQVYLPLLEDGPELFPAPVQAPPPAGIERILLVDDESDLVDFGREMLTRLGYQVTVRTSGLEALELFRAKPDRFDLVITDQTMPGLTGTELARRLLRIRPRTPVILCTGFSERIPAQETRGWGIRKLLRKPLIQQDLAQAIRQVLEGEP